MLSLVGVSVEKGKISGLKLPGKVFIIPRFTQVKLVEKLNIQSPCMMVLSYAGVVLHSCYTLVLFYTRVVLCWCCYMLVLFYTDVICWCCYMLVLFYTDVVICWCCYILMLYAGVRCAPSCYFARTFCLKLRIHSSSSYVSLSL